MTFTLVLGGARSGKSAWAQSRAEAWGAADPQRRLTLVATAEALDEEMADRIARHRTERDGRWRTLEAPLSLAETLGGLGTQDGAVVDCLTLWLTNLMLAGREVEADAERLSRALAACSARVWLVANEVGLGIVPDHSLGRAFRDAAGRLNQRLAAQADEAVILFAGLPLTLKSTVRALPSSEGQPGRAG